MPLTWSQVRAGLDASRFNIRTAGKLIAKSTAWKDYCDSERPLQKAVERLLRGARHAA
jgi:bifunctional non-homologous end joining protein LigD